MSGMKCDCGKLATWVYMPGYSDEDANEFSCDDCVSRGCSCNNRHTGNDGDRLPTEEDGIEGVDWIWVEKGIEWTVIDEKGRQYPCCEFYYDEENFKDWDDD